MVVSTHTGRKRTHLLITLSYFIYIYIHTQASCYLCIIIMLFVIVFSKDKYLNDRTKWDVKQADSDSF